MATKLPVKIEEEENHSQLLGIIMRYGFLAWTLWLLSQLFTGTLFNDTMINKFPVFLRMWVVTVMSKPVSIPLWVVYSAMTLVAEGNFIDYVTKWGALINTYLEYIFATETEREAILHHRRILWRSVISVRGILVQFMGCGYIAYLDVTVSTQAVIAGSTDAAYNGLMYALITFSCFLGEFILNAARGGKPVLDLNTEEQSLTENAAA